MGESRHHASRSLDDGRRRVLIAGGLRARYAATGHLLYMKNGTLMALPFSARLAGSDRHAGRDD